MWPFIFLALCTATAFYISTFLINFYSPLLLVGIRGIISGILVLAIQYYSYGEIKADFLKYKRPYFIVIAFGFLVPLVVQSLILSHLPPVDMSIIGSTEPLFVYTIAYFLFQERLAKTQLLFLFLGTIFAFIAIMIESGFERVLLISWQEPMLLFITLLIAIGWLTISHLMLRLKQPEGVITGVGFLVTGVVSTVLSFFLEQPKFSYQLTPIILFAVTIILGDLITTRTRAKLSKVYTQTMLALINIFSPFIVAFHEQLFHHRYYSPKFFLLLVPSMACFVIFYILERNNQASQILDFKKN